MACGRDVPASHVGLLTVLLRIVLRRNINMIYDEIRETQLIVDFSRRNPQDREYLTRVQFVSFLMLYRNVHNASCITRRRLTE